MMQQIALNLHITSMGMEEVMEDHINAIMAAQNTRF